MNVSDGRKRNEEGKILKEPVICFSCIEKIIGKCPEDKNIPWGASGLTWSLEDCPVCGLHYKICTKRKYVKGLTEN